MDCYCNCYVYTHPDKKLSTYAGVNVDKKTKSDLKGESS